MNCFQPGALAPGIIPGACEITLNTDALKAFFRLGILLFVLSVGILFVQTPGSPEFVVTVCSALIGAVLVVLVAVVARRQ